MLRSVTIKGLLTVTQQELVCILIPCTTLDYIFPRRAPSKSIRNNLGGAADRV